MTSYLADNQIKALIATIDVIVTLVFNLSILIVLTTSRRLKKDVFSRGILSLSIADLGFGFLCPLFSAIMTWIGPNSTHPQELYAFHKFIGLAFGLASIWNLALVSIVKCWIIVNPLVIMTMKTMNILLCGVWIVSLGFAGMLFSLMCNFSFDWVMITSQGDIKPSILITLYNNITLTYLIFYSWMILIFYLPGLTIICVYGKIFTVVLRQIRMIQPLILTHPDETGRNTSVWKKSVKSAKNLSIICVAYFVNYIPGLIPSLALTVTFPPWYLFGVFWLYQYSGAVNGFLYIILNRSVRTEMKNTFLCRSERPAYGSSENPSGNRTGEERVKSHADRNKSLAFSGSDSRAVKEDTGISVKNCGKEATSQAVVHGYLVTNVDFVIASPMPVTPSPDNSQASDLHS